jgi:hypothetical protein
VALGSAVLYLPTYVLWLPKQLAAAPLSMIALQCAFQGIVATVLSMLAYLKAISLLGTERAAAFLALPFNAPLGAELQFRTADAIWRGIGDASTDFNYYSIEKAKAGIRDFAAKLPDPFRILGSLRYPSKGK